MKLRFRPEAADEFSDSVSYYNAARPGLGFEFAAEVRKTLLRIKKYPDSWPKISPNVQKCVVNRFPFSVLYGKHDDYILIVAVMHMKRKPGYWKTRIK